VCICSLSIYLYGLASLNMNGHNILILLFCREKPRGAAIAGTARKSQKKSESLHILYPANSFKDAFLHSSPLWQELLSLVSMEYIFGKIGLVCNNYKKLFMFIILLVAKLLFQNLKSSVSKKRITYESKDKPIDWKFIVLLCKKLLVITKLSLFEIMSLVEIHL